MSNLDFKEKFIGFIDILGFKGMVNAAESGAGRSLPELLDLIKHLGTPESKESFVKYGPTTCPESPYIQKDLDFKVIQISDCAIVSSEVSPAGAINLINHCWGTAMMLLSEGVMCRGYITRGKIYHTDTQVIGSGYNHAYEKESNGIIAFQRDADERGTPFIEIDQIVCDYIEQAENNCVKEMFSRYVKSDGTVSAIFPFQRLVHSFAFGGIYGDFNPEKEKKSNEVLRTWLHDFKEKIWAQVDKNNASAVSKTHHYIAALDEQLKSCDKTDEDIDMLTSPFPFRRSLL